MAQRAVGLGRASIKQACPAFGISVTCYRHQPRVSSENAEIADHLIRLTHNQRNWGFGLCFLYLRNVKGHRWNHKRAYLAERMDTAIAEVRHHQERYWSNVPDLNYERFVFCGLTCSFTDAGMRDATPVPLSAPIYAPTTTRARINWETKPSARNARACATTRSAHPATSSGH